MLNATKGRRRRAGAGRSPILPSLSCDPLWLKYHPEVATHTGAHSWPVVESHEDGWEHSAPVTGAGVFLGGHNRKESWSKQLCCTYICALCHLPVRCVCSSVIKQTYKTHRHLCKYQRTTVRLLDARPNTLAGENSGTFISEGIRYFPQELAKTKNRGKNWSAVQRHDCVFF